MYLYLPINGESPLVSDVEKLLGSSNDGEVHPKKNEIPKRLEFAPFSKNPTADVQLKALEELNEELITKSVILGDGLKLLVADVYLYATAHSSVNRLSSSDKARLPHLLRWVDYIQLRKVYLVNIEKAEFVPPVSKPVSKPVKTAEDSTPKKTVQETKRLESQRLSLKERRLLILKKVEESQASQVKKKLPKKEVEKKDEELSVSLLKIRIGHIRKAWKHPSAYNLLVEEMDLGEAKCRQVVSGLAKFCTPEELTNRRVVLITNVKPGKLRDVMSEGLVLCASSKDHTVVGPLIASDGAKVGECVTFSGHDGKPEEVLNPKRKQLDKITPNLFTDEKGVATFKGIPLMTSSGPCLSSIPNGSIK
ncbi:aminoacyl tRNA synthase complex-interacting multifunctional protein 1-like [Salvia hispanica]|uniref:aminoacyl tRNA synthase complex-interacting multifunctional protein 1-like n=1 Tax=Salvia hispanica TaxID=49212 RepID=UPI00200934B5|nr:aminoacyl tRNA synthase complex-interacting multifunctional protein 1-like [Salvia hispanica]